MTAPQPKRHMGRIPVLTIPELCERWATTKWTILREIAAKRVKAFKVGRQYRILLESVEDAEQRGAR